MVKKHIGIYITDSTNKTVELPMNPAETLIKSETEDAQAIILKLGEINQVGESKLRGMTINATIPIDENSWHFSTAEIKLGDAQFYLDFLNAAHEAKKPVQLTIATTKISLTCTIASFEYGFKDAYDGEYAYTLELKEWREYKAVKIVNEVDPWQTNPGTDTRTAPPAKIGLWANVVVNGQLYANSQGDGLKTTAQNDQWQVTLIAPDTKYPYHVSSADGTARGWASVESVRLA